MRKLISLAVVLAMALLVVGCGTEQKPVDPSSTPDTVSTAEPAPAAPTEQPQSQSTATSTREPEKELKFMLEGMEEVEQVSLYQGDGYSMYMPKEGWQLENDVDDGIHEVEWSNLRNDDVELKVLHLAGKNLKQAQDWVRADKDDYKLTEDKNGNLSGQDPEDRDFIEARFFTNGNDTYVVMYGYPEEAAEGFGVRLGVIANTFELN